MHPSEACNAMANQGVVAASPIPGFLIECLVWNVPDGNFLGDSWEDNVRNCINHIWSYTKTAEECHDWGEVSELMYLFRGSPDSKREEAHSFIDAAWDFVGVQP